MASPQSPNSKKSTLADTVPGNGLAGIVGTGRIKSTISTHYRRQNHLVSSDQQDKDRFDRLSPYQTIFRKMVSNAWCRENGANSEACFLAIRWRSLLSRNRNRWRFNRKNSRACLLIRLRTTELPTFRETEIPRRVSPTVLEAKTIRKHRL